MGFDTSVLDCPDVRLTMIVDIPFASLPGSDTHPVNCFHSVLCLMCGHTILVLTVGGHQVAEACWFLQVMWVVKL